MSSPYMGLTPVKILCLTVITKHHTMGEKDFNNKRKFWEVTGFFFFFSQESQALLCIQGRYSGFYYQSKIGAQERLF